MMPALRLCRVLLLNVMMFLFVCLVLCDVASVAAHPPLYTIPTINKVIGDQSYIHQFGVPPSSYVSEALRIKIHLQYVEALLRARPTSHLSPAQRKVRLQMLNWLREYIKRGRFPVHQAQASQRYGRQPRFIDDKGTICAVGYLVERSVGRKVAERLNRRYEYAFVSQIKSPLFFRWQLASGLTMREIEMIQPAYLKTLTRSSWVKYDEDKRGRFHGVMLFTKARRFGFLLRPRPKRLPAGRVERFQVTYKHGKKEGTWRYWVGDDHKGLGIPYATSRLTLAGKGAYQNNKKHGKWFMYRALYLPSDGGFRVEQGQSLHSLTTYVQGKEHGLFFVAVRSEKTKAFEVVEKGIYERGKRCGPWLYRLREHDYPSKRTFPACKSKAFRRLLQKIPQAHLLEALGPKAPSRRLYFGCLHYKSARTCRTQKACQWHRKGLCYRRGSAFFLKEHQQYLCQRTRSYKACRTRSFCRWFKCGVCGSRAEKPLNVCRQHARTLMVSRCWARYAKCTKSHNEYSKRCQRLHKSCTRRDKGCARRCCVRGFRRFSSKRQLQMVMFSGTFTPPAFSPWNGLPSGQQKVLQSVPYTGLLGPRPWRAGDREKWARCLALRLGRRHWKRLTPKEWLVRALYTPKALPKRLPKGFSHKGLLEALLRFARHDLLPLSLAKVDALLAKAKVPKRLRYKFILRLWSPGTALPDFSLDAESEKLLKEIEKQAQHRSILIQKARVDASAATFVLEKVSIPQTKASFHRWLLPLLKSKNYRVRRRAARFVVGWGKKWVAYASKHVPRERTQLAFWSNHKRHQKASIHGWRKAWVEDLNKDGKVDWVTIVPADWKEQAHYFTGSEKPGCHGTFTRPTKTSRWRGPLQRLKSNRCKHLLKPLMKVMGRTKWCSLILQEGLPFNWLRSKHPSCQRASVRLFRSLGLSPH